MLLAHLRAHAAMGDAANISALREEFAAELDALLARAKRALAGRSDDALKFVDGARRMVDAIIGQA